MSDGTIAGRMYGLLGFKLTNDPESEKYFAQYASDPALVETMEGCIVRQTTAEAIALAIKTGRLK